MDHSTLRRLALFALLAWPQVGLAKGPWKHLADTADGIRVSARVDSKIKAVSYTHLTLPTKA